MRATGSLDGDIAAIIQEGRDGIAAALRVGMDAASARVQEQLRGQVRAAGLGAGLEKAWQQRSYGGAKTLHPAALVYSKATLLHQVFTEGATIQARTGRYLAIPTREAEALGFATARTNRAGKGTGSIPRRASMVADAIKALGEENTATLPLPRGRKLLVYKTPSGRSSRGGKAIRRGANVPLFILVPMVRLSPRLDVDSVRAAAGGVLAGEIAAALG